MIAVKGENCQSGQKSKYQTTVYFQEAHFKYKDTDRLKVKRQRKKYHGKYSKERQSGYTNLRQS